MLSSIHGIKRKKEKKKKKKKVYFSRYRFFNFIRDKERYYIRFLLTLCFLFFYSLDSLPPTIDLCLVVSVNLSRTSWKITAPHVISAEQDAYMASPVHIPFQLTASESDDTHIYPSHTENIYMSILQLAHTTLYLERTVFALKFQQTWMRSEITNKSCTG